MSRRTYDQAIRRGGLYRITTSTVAIHAHQLQLLNAVWADAIRNVPFYKAWQMRHGLAETVSSLAELRSWPIVSKRELQAAGPDLLRPDRRPTNTMKTGGSTGEPLCIPVGPEDGLAASSQWLGRSPFGFHPGMRTFLLWGHEHLYGRGLDRRIKVLQRRAKDRLSNMCRVSAYDLSPQAMRVAFSRLEAFQPECVIGFSAAVLAFCRVNHGDGRRVARAPRFVLCSAGPLSAAEKLEIRSFFGAPVCMEYGAVECGIMAYTCPNEPDYRVFWDTHLLQGAKDASGELRNIVTRLSSCYLPLIRYDVGDYLDAADPDADSLISLVEVKGRPSDIVTLGDGTAFFGALIGDCVKQVSDVTGSQTIAHEDGIEVLVTASRSLSEEQMRIVHSRLILVVPQLVSKRVTVRQVEQLTMTAGGKIPLVIPAKPSGLRSDAPVGKAT